MSAETLALSEGKAVPQQYVHIKGWGLIWAMKTGQPTRWNAGRHASRAFTGPIPDSRCKTSRSFNPLKGRASRRYLAAPCLRQD